MTHRNHIGLFIDPVTNDLAVDTNRNLKFARNAEAVGQHVRQRLLTYAREWFLDITVGVVWLDEIMGKRYDPALAEAIVKAVILDTDGVEEITAFSVSFDRDPRRLNIKGVELTTTYDVEEAIRV